MSITGRPLAKFTTLPLPGAPPQKILEAHPQRIGGLFYNDGTGIVYLTNDPSVTSVDLMFPVPAGGSLSIAVAPFSPTDALFAVGAAGHSLRVYQTINEGDGNPRADTGARPRARPWWRQLAGAAAIACALATAASGQILIPPPGGGGAPSSVTIKDGVGATLATVTAGNALKVDGSAVTQPVSGTVTANQGGAPWTQRLQDGAGATLASVTATNALNVEPTKIRAYNITVNAQVTTAAYTVSIEAGASQGFRLRRWCVQTSAATAAVVVNVTVNRRSTASSAGTLIANEATASPSVSKMDPADANYPGVVRLNGTLGTIGALLDGATFNMQQPIAGDVGIPNLYCKEYGTRTEKMPVVAAGTANGLTIAVTAAGAGGAAAGHISATIITD